MLTKFSALFFFFSVFLIWFYIFRPANQRLVQAPLAAVACTISFLLWALVAQHVAAKGLSLRGRQEFVWTFLLALVWAPVIFVPLHYVTQGYLTSFGNITALWLFQAPTNAIIILIVAASTLARSHKEGDDDARAIRAA